MRNGPLSPAAMPSELLLSSSRITVPSTAPSHVQGPSYAPDPGCPQGCLWVVQPRQDFPTPVTHQTMAP